MKKLSLTMLAGTVAAKRKAKHLTQNELSQLTGIHRAQLSRLEAGKYTPSVNQLVALSEVLQFDPMSLLFDETTEINVETIITGKHLKTEHPNSQHPAE